MAGVVFQEQNLSFTAGLARWLNQPKEPLIKEVAEGSEEVEPTPCSAFESECVALEEKSAFEELSVKLGSGLTKLFAEEDASALQSAYAIYLQLLVQWNLLTAKVEALAEEFSSSVSERPGLRRSLLISLYSLVQQYGMHELRFVVLVRLIKFASAAGQMDQVFGEKGTRVASMERWTSEWALSEEQKKELWGLFLDAHADEGAVVYSYALKYLALFSDADLATNASLRQRLVSSILLTIRNPSLFQCDELAQLLVVKQLEKDKEYSQLYRLLRIVASETFAEYSAFQTSAEGRAFMEKHGLEHEACSKKMRLLSLVSLGQKEKELPYSTIAAALEVDVSEVESWVMETIGADLIGAKMDQVTKTVYVRVTIEREFAAQQWKRFHENLGDWRDSIRGLLTVIQGSRPSPGN